MEININRINGITPEPYRYRLHIFTIRSLSSWLWWDFGILNFIYLFDGLVAKFRLICSAVARWCVRCDPKRTSHCYWNVREAWMNVDWCRFCWTHAEIASEKIHTFFLVLCVRGANEGPHGVCASDVHILSNLCGDNRFSAHFSTCIRMISIVYHSISRLFANADILNDNIISDCCTMLDAIGTLLSISTIWSLLLRLLLTLISIVENTLMFRGMARHVDQLPGNVKWWSKSVPMLVLDCHRQCPQHECSLVWFSCSAKSPVPSAHFAAYGNAFFPFLVATNLKRKKKKRNAH